MILLLDSVPSHTLSFFRYTFDGLAHDCQGDGEFILLKSEQRLIQARFAHFDPLSAGSWSVTKGVAIRDNEHTPLVQLNIPVLDVNKGTTVKLGEQSCPVLFYINGVERDVHEGSGIIDQVVVAVNENDIEIKYVESKLKVTVTFGSANERCYIDVIVYLPDKDASTIGLLGSADGDVWNDWTNSEGEHITVPDSLMNRMQQDGYEYCTKHWCLREEVDSLQVRRGHKL